MTEAIDQESPPPALFTHCVRMYNAMKAEARIDDETGDLLYRGFLSSLVTAQLKLSTPYYSHCTKALKQMQCIAMVTRGGGTSQSVWRLLKSPNRPDFELMVSDDDKTGTKRNLDALSKRNSMEEQIVAITARMVKLEARVDKFVDIIVRMDEKLKEKSNG